MRQFLRQRGEAGSINVGALLKRALKHALFSDRFLCVVICVGKIFELNAKLFAPFVCSLAS